MTSSTHFDPSVRPATAYDALRANDHSHPLKRENCFSSAEEVQEMMKDTADKTHEVTAASNDSARFFFALKGAEG